MVFQNYALYPHMTVADNMGFSLKLRGAKQDEIASGVKRAAEILGLTPLLERYPRQLSGGQRQRVAMGRAIVRDPQVFLFDEPLSNLDAKLRVAMRTEIKELHQRLKTTTVYVTHDQIEAMTMADKIVVMHDGIVEQIGAPLDLYDKPDNQFVAGFIGSPAMNFLKGKVKSNGAAGFEGPNGVKLPLASAPANSDGRPAVYGVRPEHFTIADDGAEAEIVVVEPTGSETQVVRQARRRAGRRRVPRAPSIQAGRQDPAQTRPVARASVRRGDRQATERLKQTQKSSKGGTTMHDFTRRSLLQGGTALAAAGALTGPALLDFAKAWAQAAPWKAGAGRQAHRDALEALRAGRRRCLQRHGRRLQGRHRHRDERVQRVLRGRAAEGLRCRQHRLGPRSRLGPAHAAAAVPDQGPEDERRCRLPRQEIRRLDRRGAEDLQAGQRLARHPRRHRRRLL